MKTLFLIGVASALQAQTWTDLGSGTQLDSIKPQNCNNTGSPSYCNGVVFPYADNFYSIISAWGGGMARAKSGSEQMLFFGGGHVVYFGNQVASVNLTSNTVTALTTPSVPYGSGSPVTVSNITCQNPNSDTTPVSVHSYGQMAYLTTADKMFFWDMAQNAYCGSGAAPTNYVWYFDPVAKTWSIKNNAGTIGLSGSQLASCALDTSFGVTAHESVVCMVVYGGGRSLVRFDDVSNTWTTLIAYGVKAFPYAGSVAIDPVRKLLFAIGSTVDPSGSLSIVKVDMSTSAYTFTDVTASSSGCSALNVRYPGVAYDSISTHNIQVWPSAGNTVYEFNPDTYACTAHSPSGGPPAPAAPTAGTFGRFAAFPSLGKFVAVNSTTNNAFAYDPGTPPVITNPASAGAITAGTQNSAYSFPFAASGTLPLVWSITSGAPPTGVSINSSTGVLAGTPTASGNFSFTISVTNGYGSPSTQNDTLAIAAVCLVSPTTNLPAGKFNVPYSQAVPTAGCTSPTFARTSGTLPTGMSLNTGTGVISGTPTVPGLFSFTIGITDAAGNPSQAYTITIIPGPGVLNVLSVPGLVYR